MPRPSNESAHSKEYRKNGFVISADRERLDLEVIHEFLSECYWCKGIPRECCGPLHRECILLWALRGPKAD
jgi:hypothetical protein